MSDAEADAAGGENEMGGEAPGPDASPPCPTLASIQRAYEAGQEETARDLIRQAACARCSGTVANCVHVDGVLRVVSQYGDARSVRYLLQEAEVRVPTEVSDQNPAVVAAHSGHSAVLRILLDAIPGVRQRRDLLNLLLSTSCQRGHVDSVRLLVQDYGADAKDSNASHSDRFTVISALPLYAAAQAGSEELADFLLQNGAGLSSYTLMDHPDFSTRLLTRRLEHSTQDGQQVVSVRWSGLSLPWLEVSWLMGVSCLVTHLDLSHNNLSSLPSVLPWGLLCLETLDLSHNRLGQLPPAAASQEVICTRLCEVNVRGNQLSALPAGLLHLRDLKKLCASKNRLTTLFDMPPPSAWAGLRKLEDLDVSDNRLSALPADVTRALKSLRRLDVSRNRLGGFPDCWACPLNRCRASCNKMRDLPDNISVFWKNHLHDVDFSDNLLEHLPPSLFRLEALLSLKLCGNVIRTLPPPSDWTCSQLRTLDLSRNLLGKSEEGPKSRKLSFLTTWSKKDPDPGISHRGPFAFLPSLSTDPPLGSSRAGCPVEFPAVLRDSLEVLYLNNNRLECVPPSVCALSGLSELYLANNPGIRELPSELAGLSNLWQLDIENLNISNVPQDVRREGSAAVLAFLRAHLRRAVPCRLLKMLLIGPPRQGKSSLLRALRTGKASPPFTPAAERSVSTSTWEMECGSDAAGKNNRNSSLALNVWDVGGPSSMSALTQCFFTDSALYVLTWNLTLGEEAVAGLQTWLLNIEARAPNSAVVVVGTHLDLIDTKFRTERLATLRAYILALCRTPSGARAGGYPDVAFGHLREVSCKTLEGVDGLKKLIRQVALSVKDGRASACGGKLLGRMIPRSHVRLQEAAAAEKRRRHADGEVQFLTQAQLESMAERHAGSDIADYDDLPSAVKFLMETGTLLHFPDTSRGLCTLYFLCPEWLAECLQRIVRLESTRSLARNGVIRAQDLRMLLVGTGFTRDTEEQYFQFLAKFEIALPVANNSYLLPHLLPAKPGVDIHCFRQPSGNTLERLFKMSFVPVGFWERFIARMLISLTDMDLQSSDAERGAGPRRGRTAFYNLGGSGPRNRRSTFRVRRRQTVYWREGLLVTFEGGYLSVESTDVNWKKKKKSGGVKVVCRSESRDFSAAAFVTDHVNALVEQWFPALTASESDGSPLLERYAPCPLCAARLRQSGTRAPDDGDGGGVHLFDVEECALAAAEGDSIACPEHPRHAVPLRELVPELFMTDFPARLFLEKEHLEYSEDESSVIGQGGSGTVVYRARYRQRPVAIKRFRLRTCRQNAPSADADTMMKRLQSAAACRCFSEFRQEAAALHSLRHPCVVALVGVSIHPLRLALELAPLGSLNNVLEERRRGGGYVPLGHMITYKMAYQVAAGLAYLHRKNVIFCDLKSDNILVWSLQEQAAVNVKLSDYGVCRRSFHEGALGVEGTPAYQAPEVRPGIVYDEKVDMFSYAMVTYELLSGRRPSVGRRRLPKTAAARGVRPPLASPQEVGFYFLQRLMTQCWDTKPEKRPTASECVRRMMDPSFACLRYVLPCGADSQLFLPPVGGEHVVLWEGDAADRRYSVVNVHKGQLEVNKKSCPGSRVSCHVKLGNTLWLATHEQEVLVYVLKDMCPLTRPHKHLSCPAVITCFLKLPGACGVFAGTSDGQVALYGAEEAGLPVEGHAPSALIAGDPGQRPAPVTCMLLIGCGRQLWLSSGPGVLVVDRASLSPVRRLDPYVFPSSVVSMATGFGVRGEESVWTLDDVTDTLVLFHAASFQFCGDRSPLRDVFPICRPTALGADEDEEEEEEEEAELADSAVTVADSEEAGTQIVRRRDWATDGSASSEENADVGVAPPSLEREDGEDGRRGAAESSPPSPRALKLLMVNDTLWVFRRGGDVLLIHVEPHGEQTRGRVAAVLRPPSEHALGTPAEAGLVGEDAVACGFRGAPSSSDVSVCVWRAWDAARLDVFYRSAEDLARSDGGVRRRR
ncbi:leucine-rich repeat serine/threonine-protein kinase 1 isoform X2 [Phycodurus eques]|uniref:leucine-rich repeat serine/threonine-protein kinase 1 isoform X2 n=1 Tax=Phycodurus eques TaxID=693459 RepID=UPI002ACDD388|nr:leucine-rich repeat serine/threonine-protein kinase 1 isoform X2 [Phycodurus eques]